MVPQITRWRRPPPLAVQPHELSKGEHHRTHDVVLGPTITYFRAESLLACERILLELGNLQEYFPGQTESLDGPLLHC